MSTRMIEEGNNWYDPWRPANARSFHLYGGGAARGTKDERSTTVVLINNYDPPVQTAAENIIHSN